MVLQFQPPPDWLAQEYMKDRNQNPVVEGLQGAAQIVQGYQQTKALKQRTQNEALKGYIDAYNVGGPSFAKEIASRMGLSNPPVIPGSQSTGPTPGAQPPSPSTGTASGYLPTDITPVEQAAQQSLPSEHPAGVSGAPSISPLIQASIAAGHPNPMKYQIPSQDQVGEWMGQGAYGQKKLGEAKVAKELFADKTKTPVSTRQYGALQSGDQADLASAFPEGIPPEYIGPSLSATARNVTVLQGPSGTPIRVSKTAGSPAETVDVPGVSNTTNPIQSKLTPNEYKDWVQEVNQFDSDPVVKADRGILANLNQIQTEIAKYNKSMTGPLRSQQARAIAREVGALTDSDVARQALDPSMLGRLKSWISIAATGEIPDDQLALLQSTVKTINQSAASRISNVANERAMRKSNLYGGKVSSQDLMGSLNLPTNFSVPSKTGPHGPTVTQKGHVFTWNGTTYE